MLQKQTNLYNISQSLLFEKIKEHLHNYEYDFKKHLIILKDENHGSIGYIRLPLQVNINEGLIVGKQNPIIVYLSIESGNGALCVYQGKKEVYHKAFSAYTTRKKQGFNQVKYLNKKGKSRAGSRVRLAATIQFFENANSLLQSVFKEHEIDRIALNCDPTLIPYLHQSKVSCPFEKHDERLYKIPLHIQQSNYTNLTGAIKKLLAPILFYHDQYEEIVKDFIDPLISE